MNELASTLTIAEGQTLKDLVQEYERQLLLMALELAGWNQRRVAASLGLLPSTLSEKMKRLGLRSTRSETAIAAEESQLSQTPSANTQALSAH